MREEEVEWVRDAFAGGRQPLSHPFTATLVW